MRLIDADATWKLVRGYRDTKPEESVKRKFVCNTILLALMDEKETPTIDAVPVVRIKQAKDEILSRMSEFITEYRLYSESTVDHFGGKADAMDVAKRLVNAVLTDLCSYGERKDGDG